MENTQTRKKSYKYCVVPMCANTTKTAPDKYFFPLPTDKATRAEWCKIMKRDPLSVKTVRFCCEDHFDVEADTKNLMRYKLMGGGLYLKPDIFPHRFDCQTANLTDDKTMKRLRIYSSDLPMDDKDSQPTEFIECVPELDVIKSEPVEYLDVEIEADDKESEDEGPQNVLPTQESLSSPFVKTRHLLQTEEERLKFVQEIVKYRSSLITNKGETKSRKRKRQIALKAVSEKLNVPGLGPREVYTKVKSFKASYLKELRKIKKVARGTNYVSNVNWFETMDNAVKAEEKETQESSSEIDEETSPSDIEEKSNDMQSIKKEDNSVSIKVEVEVEQMNTDSEIETKDNIVKIDNANDANDTENVKIDNAKDASNTKLKTEFDLFGERVAAQLRSMRLPDALEAQMFIQNYLTNMRLQSMRQVQND